MTSWKNYIRGGYCNLVRLVVRKEKRDEFGFRQEDFVIISVGELNENKNHKVIIDAISRCCDSHIQYVLCGIGPLEKRLQEQVQELGLRMQVHLLGFRTDIKELLWMSDCFAFPSKREGLGLAAIEAMSAGIPLITSYVHGIMDYSIDGITGSAVKNNSCVEYSRSIKRHKSDESYRYRCGQNCESVSENFETYKIQKIMRKIYSREN